MKNKITNLLYLVLFTSFLFVTGCKKEDTTEPVVEVNESELLVKHLEANGDFINTSGTALITASDLYTGMQASKDWPIIDIRSSADYAAGHIAGAKLIAPADLLTYYNSNNLGAKEKVIIACYTGQTAAWATSLLRLAGKTNVFDLKFGMCSWNSATAARWKNAVGNGKAATFVSTATPKPAAGNLPKLSTGKTTGADILTARVNAVLAEGFTPASISVDAVYSNLSNYFIANYWPADQYNWGHINGAVQYTPKVDLKLDGALKTLPTNKTVVVYCYTGMTSGHTAAYLRLLGYDAKSLLYGVNAMSYDNMPGTKWNNSEIKEYPLVQ